jgi:hypothetical protein
VYRSDGKNWITVNAEPYFEDLFSSSDQGRSFTYRITAIDNETYGSQYGQTSSELRISVPQKVLGEPPVTTGVETPSTTAQVPSANTPTSVVDNSAAIAAEAKLAARTVKAKKNYSAKSLAKQVGIKTVSSKATVTMSVAKSSKKNCAISKAKLSTLKTGNCVVIFTVQEPKSKNGKLPKATKTTKTLVVK